MSFLGIGFLLGLVGIALPLAIHIFGKKRKVIQPWGAMRFLDEAKPSWKRRTLRLQDVLILLLRIAAVALLALAFARPVFKVPLPPENAHELLMIVDRSPSTELGAENGTRLADEIFERTSQLLEAVPPATRVHFFLNGASSVLLNIPPESGNPFNEARNQSAWLDSLKVQLPASDTHDWLESIRGVLEGPDAGQALSRQVVIIADATKHGWPIENEAETKIPESWGELMKEHPDCTVFFVPIGADHPHRQRANLAIDLLDIDQPRIQTGKEITLRATISNRGATANSPARARWTKSAEHVVIAEEAIPKLEPGEVHELILKRSFPEAGPIAIQLELEVANDALASDNVAAKVVEVVDRVPVAVIIDVPPDHLDDPKSRFANWTFAAAAGHPDSIAFGDHEAPVQSPPAGTEHPFFELKWLTPRQLGIGTVTRNHRANQETDSGDKIDPDDFAVVVWSVADASSLDRGALTERLRPFVSRGGGLWLQPPPDVNPDAFNQIFFPHEFGMSPAGIDTVQKVMGGDKDKSIGLRPPGDDGPRLFSKAVSSSLAELQLNRYLALSQRHPLSSEVLLEFEGGKPFVIRRQLGKGEVILTTLDTNPDSGNLAACVGYLPFVREILWHLAATRSPKRNFSAGEVNSRNISKDASGVRLPNGEWKTLDPADGNSSFETPGLYWLETRGSTDLAPISISGIPLESETRAIPQVYLDRLDQVEGIENLNPKAQSDLDHFKNQFARGTDLKSPEGHFEIKEIWAWFLVGLLGFLTLEVILAHHLLTRRRSSLRN